MNFEALFAPIGGIRPIGGQNRFRPMTEAEISTFEKLIGAALPEPYRVFLATYGASTFNGASQNNPYVVFRSLEPLPPHIEKNGKALFDAFYGAEADARDPLGLRVRFHFFTGRMPESIIPIGDDGGAGQICLGIKGAEAGKVYYWDQQNEPPDEEDHLEDYGEPRPPGAIFQNVYQIAESFQDFLQRLEPRSDC